MSIPCWPAGLPKPNTSLYLYLCTHSLLQSLSSMQQGRRRTFWLLAAKKCTVNKTAYHHMINLLHIYCSIIYNPAKLSYIFGFDQGDQIKIKYLTLQIRPLHTLGPVHTSPHSCTTTTNDHVIQTVFSRPTTTSSRPQRARLLLGPTKQRPGQAFVGFIRPKKEELTLADGLHLTAS